MGNPGDGGSNWRSPGMRSFADMERMQQQMRMMQMRSAAFGSSDLLFRPMTFESSGGNGGERDSKRVKDAVSLVNGLLERTDQDRAHKEAARWVVQNDFTDREIELVWSISKLMNGSAWTKAVKKAKRARAEDEEAQRRNDPEYAARKAREEAAAAERQAKEIAERALRKARDEARQQESELRSKVEKYFLKTQHGLAWDDVVGNDTARTALIEAIEHPVVHKELYAHYRKRATKGVLLYGPPGCGKTMFGKAAASILARLHGKGSAEHT